MRQTAILTVALAIASLAGSAKADPDNFTQVERGRSLAIAGDCMGCHVGADKRSLSGGELLGTPFGNIAVPNITPDKKTGLGTWSSDAFYRAMHSGIGPGGEHLYPAFPYTAFTKMSRSDTDAVLAYLKTLPPVENDVKRNTLPFPFNIRTAMLGWNWLNFKPGEFKSDPAKSDAFNRGAYLVEGPGHCGLCHTPRNVIGGDKDSHHLEGGDLQGWFAPNITSNKRLGIGDWSKQELVEYLKNGMTVRGVAGGPMAEVVGYSTSHMDDADLNAIATYLKESPGEAAEAAQPLAGSDPAMLRGSAIYADTCSACHAADGSGVTKMFPRLANNQNTQQIDPSSMLRVILQGSRAVATSHAITAPAMPSLGWRLDDQQIADVSTYVRNSWGNAAASVSSDQVEALRSLTGTKTAVGN